MKIGDLSKYDDRINELDTYVYNNMGKCKQICIDTIEDIQSEFFHESGPPDQESEITRDAVMAKAWDISLILEVVDTVKYPEVLDTLTKIHNVLDELGKELDAELQKKWAEERKVLGERPKDN